MATTEDLPTRNRELIAVCILMVFMSTFFTVWRVVVRHKIIAWMGPSDWLMVFGMVMNNAAIIVAVVGGCNGAGRVMRDPFWQPDQMEKKLYLNHLTFGGQLVNVYSVFVLKLSICAYLLELNFSRTYRRVIWGTVAFVVCFNLILPATQHFGMCRPFASRWDTRITDKQCWSQGLQMGVAYTQAISHIVTDLIYATAPVLYLRSVQLSKRTQWSVRAVFFMSLLCTTISAIKLYDFQRIQGLKETYYESVTLSIWSITEVSVGIVVANLPPLRKYFDSILKRILRTAISDNISSGNKSSGPQFQVFSLSSYRGQPGRRSTIEGMTGRSERLHSTGDNESDKAILEEVNAEDMKKDCIMKTTQVNVDNESRRGSGERLCR